MRNHFARRAVNALSLAALILAPLAWSTVTPVFGSVPWPDRIVDYKLIHEFSRMVVVDHVYPPIFPYPPSAVCLLYPLNSFSFSSTALIWLILIALATTGVFVLASRLVGLSDHPYRWPITVLGMASVGYFVVTDLRATNCNMLYLFFLTAGLTSLQKGHATRGSLLLAVSMSLKIYSVAMFAYLAARGEWRAAFRTAGWVMFLWVVPPMVIFGIDGTVAVYRSWFDQINRLMLGHDHYDFINLASLRKGLFAQFSPESASQILLLCRAVWGSLLTASLILVTISIRRGSTRGGIDWALGTGMMALAIGATSPFLEVYHFVPAALVSMAFLAIIVDPRESTWLRTGLALSMVLAWSILKFGPKGAERGIGLYAYAVCLAAMVVIVWSTKAPATATQETDSRDDDLPLSREFLSRAA